MRLVVALPHYPWPPVGGSRLRSWHLNSALAGRHETHLFALQSPDEPPGDLAAPHPFASVDTMAIPTSNPPRWSPAWGALRMRSLVHPGAAFYQPEAAARFSALVARVRPEAVVYGMTWMLPYAESAPNIRGIADEHNYDPLIAWRVAQRYSGLNRLKWLAFAELGAKAERRYLARMRGVAACSQEDAVIFKAEAPHADVAIVPNGVDTARFTAAPPGEGVVMTASWAYRPNAEGAERLVRRIWPLVRRDMPQATLRLVGMKGEVILREFASEPGVTVTGMVPDVRPELAGARVAVAPLDVGGGTRLKILEAFAAGRPVVSTRIGAEGIEARDGDALFVRDDDAGFAQAIVRLLRDPALAESMGAKGRAIAADKYDWRISAQAFEELVSRVAG